jgi:hypothetical protein
MSETVAAPALRGRFHVGRILVWTLGIAVPAATLDPRLGHRRLVTPVRPLVRTRRQTAELMLR